MTAATPVLHPLSAGELLDHAIYLYRKNFVTALGIVALTNLPVLVLQLGQSLVMPAATVRLAPAGAGFTSSYLIYSLLTILVAAVSVVATGLHAAALAVLVGESYAGRSTTIALVYRRVLARGLSVLGAQLIFALGTVVLYGSLILVGAVSLLHNSDSRTGTTLVGLVTLLICCIILPLILPFYLLLYTRWFLSVQCIILENRGALSGLKRSWSLVGGHFWRVLSIWFALVLFVSLPEIGLVLLARYLAGLVLPSTVALIASQVAGGIMVLFISPIVSLVTALLYYDLRIRKEGYDLEVRAEALQLTNITSSA